MRALLSWETPEFVRPEGSAKAYWFFVIASAALILGALYFENYLFALFVFLASIVIVFTRSRTPRTIQVHISERGVQVGTTLYPYENVARFCIRESLAGSTEYGALGELVLELNRRLAPHVEIPVHPEDAAEIRDVLLNFIEEEPIEKSLLDVIIAWLGF